MQLTRANCKIFSFFLLSNGKTRLLQKSVREGRIGWVVLERGVLNGEGRKRDDAEETNHEERNPHIDDVAVGDGGEGNLISLSTRMHVCEVFMT